MARVTYAKKIWKISPNFDNNKFANVVTGVETWIEFYESRGKVRNKIWATISTKRSCTARRCMSVQKLMYVNFFSTHGPPIQIAMPSQLNPIVTRY